MKLLVDAGISPKIPFELNRMYPGSKATRDITIRNKEGKKIPLAHATDREVYDYAKKHDFVLVTNNKGIKNLIKQKVPGPKTLFIRTPKKDSVVNLLEYAQPEIMEFVSSPDAPQHWKITLGEINRYRRLKALYFGNEKQEKRMTPGKTAKQMWDKPLLFDENISAYMPDQLANTFPGAAHISDYVPTGTMDEDIWVIAREHGYAVVTRDDDFLMLSHRGNSMQKVVYVPDTGAKGEEIRALLEKRADAIRTFLKDPDATVIEFRVKDDFPNDKLDGGHKHRPLLLDTSTPQKLAAELKKAYPGTVHVHDVLGDKPSRDAVADYALKHDMAILTRRYNFQTYLRKNRIPVKAIYLAGETNGFTMSKFLRERQDYVRRFLDDEHSGALDFRVKPDRKKPSARTGFNGAANDNRTDKKAKPGQKPRMRYGKNRRNSPNL